MFLKTVSSASSLLTMAKACLRVIYPDVTIEPKVGDYTQFRVRAYNSYDGKWPFSEECDGVRLLCTNGMVSPRMISAQRLRHTTRINIEGVSNRIVQNFEMFQTQQEVWSKMMLTKVDKKQCLEFFKKRVCYNQGKTTKEPFSLKQFARLSDQLTTKWAFTGRHSGRCITV